MRQLSSLHPHARSVALGGSEVVLAVGAATAVVALLEPSTPATGLGMLYLLAVLAVAIRRGQLAALATAVLGVLTLNYLYIAPRHRPGSRRRGGEPRPDRGRPRAGGNAARRGRVGDPRRTKRRRSARHDRH